MTDIDIAPPRSAATDLQDERLRQPHGVTGAARALVDRVRGGELGLLPVVAGLVVISTVLQILNPIFLSSTNLVNLLLECVPIGVIALGVVCVLLVGEIDLSVGSVSGLASAAVAILFVNQGLPVLVAILGAVALGSLIGWVYAQMFNRFGVPSFVITLAGLLAFVGLQLKVLGAIGSVNLPFDSGLVHFAQLAFLPAWLAYALVVAAAVALFAGGYAHARARRKAGLSDRSVRALAARSVLLLLGLGFAVWYLNRTRGVGWMFVFFVALVLLLHYALSRTKWGKSVYAVGGNVEAARRAASTCVSSIPRCSCSAPRSPRSAGSWPRPGSPPPTRAAAEETSTSTPSPPRSSAAPASSAGAAPPSPPCSASSSSSPSPAVSPCSTWTPPTASWSPVRSCCSR